MAGFVLAFFVIANTKVECQQAYKEQIQLLGELGFQINWDKAVGTCQQLPVERQLTLPEWKLSVLQCLLSETTAKRSITKQDFQSLIGKLNFAVHIVFDGRTFLWCMIVTVNHMQTPHHVRINTRLRAGLE